MTLLIGALIACVFVATTLGLQLWRARLRRARFKGLELRPNCLLTRHPIAFLSGPRHLFRLFDYWNDVPLYLREHGYEVFVIEPMRGDARLRQKSLEELLHSFDGKCHLIADASQENEIQAVARGRYPAIASLTVIRGRTHPPRLKKKSNIARTLDDFRPLDIAVEDFQLHESPNTIWSLESPFLDLAISLAERDMNDVK